VFPKIFLLHEVVRDAKKVEKHWPRRLPAHVTLVRLSGSTFRCRGGWCCYMLQASYVQPMGGMSDVFVRPIV